METTSCPQPSGHGTVYDVSGSDLKVRLPDSSEAVLHTGGATIYRKDPDGCVAITPGEVTTGSNVAFDVDAWAESYPLQGWPTVVVVG